MVKDIIVLVMLLIAITVIAYGFYLMWQPLGYIVCGGIILALAISLDSREGGDNKS